MIGENSEKKDVKKRAYKPTDSKKEAVNLKSVLSENENLKTEIRLLKLKIDAVNDKSYIEGLETEINILTEEIEDKNEVLSLHLDEIKLKDETISGFQKALFITDKEIKILKQTIKDINKKYNDSEEMYEELLTRFIKLSDENEQRKQASSIKKPIVTKFRIFGICILTKTSI